MDVVRFQDRYQGFKDPILASDSLDVIIDITISYACFGKYGMPIA